MSGPVDPALQQGADTLLCTCLAVGHGDRVLIITDRATERLARIVESRAERLAPTELVVVPSLDERYDDARAMISAALRRWRPTVTVFAAADELDRLAWDPTFYPELDALGARHAHLPALDEACLAVGMTVDYREVARFSGLLRDRLTTARELHVRNERGTDLRLVTHPERSWTAFDGLYGCAGQGGRLPQGEVFATPATAGGVLAASVVGYPFNAATGLLTEPLRIEVSDGSAVAISHPDRDLADRVWRWLSDAPGGLRVGELALGTSRELPGITGNLLFDENVPGVHVALGHPFPELTGADWESPVHVDLVVERPDVVVDGAALLVAGDYTDLALTP
ncbi:aminopeptidase [Nocardioides ginsengisoli]|uniref:Aminopeptidase n=1 Tax=Nocardioides ginsengisoli TaxID=363868 RepID=A0ABW3W6A0_9ACTN